MHNNIEFDALVKTYVLSANGGIKGESCNIITQHEQVGKVVFLWEFLSIHLNKFLNKNTTKLVV
jgi:hypothetical protein